MSYIDIFVIACAGLGLIFGLFGKAPRKVWRLLLVIGSVVAAYFLYGQVVETLLAQEASTFGLTGTGTVEEFVIDYLSAVQLGEMTMDLSNLYGLVKGIIGFLVFWVCALALMLVSRILLGWLAFVFCGKKAKKHTAVCTIGLMGAIKGAIVGIVLIVPVVVLSPALAESNRMLTSVSQIMGSSEDTPETTYHSNNDVLYVDADGESAGSELDLTEFSEYAVLVENNVKSSFMIDFCLKACKKFNFSFLTYTMGETEGNLLTDVENLPDLVDSTASMMVALNSSSGEGGESNPVEALMNIPDEDLRTVFSNPVAAEAMKGAIVGIVESMGGEGEGAIPEEALDALKNMDLAAEAETIIVIKNVVEFDESGAPSGIDLTNTTPDEIIDAIADSALLDNLGPIVNALAGGSSEGGEGEGTNMIAEMLTAAVDEDTKDSIENALEAKLADEAGDFSVEDYNKVAAYFGITQKPVE